MANTGVDVSWGRVTKAFEIIPVKGRPVKASCHLSLAEQTSLAASLGLGFRV